MEWAPLDDIDIRDVAVRSLADIPTDGSDRPGCWGCFADKRSMIRRLGDGWGLIGYILEDNRISV